MQTLLVAEEARAAQGVPGLQAHELERRQGVSLKERLQKVDKQFTPTLSTVMAESSARGLLRAVFLSGVVAALKEARVSSISVTAIEGAALNDAELGSVWEGGK